MMTAGRLALAPVLAAALATAGCHGTSPAPAGAPAMQSEPAATVSQLYPGGDTPPPPDPRAAQYEGNAQHIANGSHYFDWYNCSGCHFHGAGGIGPAFLDKKWIYGGTLTDIYHSIADGRPNGMPTWRGKIPDAQIWEIAAYVKSLSDNAKGSPDDAKLPAPAESATMPVVEGPTLQGEPQGSQ
jgi:cytochrome c oxidase cbb3-type subunit 3